MDNRRTERTPHKCFRCGSEDNLIAKCPKAPKVDDKQRKQLRFCEGGNHASQKYCNNGENNKKQKIYTPMSHMSGNDKIPMGYFGDSS